MHAEALDWVSDFATAQPVSVLDLGGRDVNGSPRFFFPNATVYRVLDILPGEGVDIVADAATWQPDRQYDVVVCCETFEHAKAWPQICRTAFEACAPGGRFIVTCAGPGRPLHSGIDGYGRLHPGEWYENVDPDRLWDVLEECGWQDVDIEYLQAFPFDTRASAVK